MICHQNPLQIPEIISLIGGHLELNDLIRCLLVSKAFHQVYIREVWKSIKTRKFTEVKSSSAKTITPTKELLEKYKHFIKSIEFQNVYPKYLFDLVECKNLRTIVVDQPQQYSWYDPDGSWERDIYLSTAGLIRNHSKTIQNISLSFYADFIVTPPNEIWVSILSCNILDSLYLNTLVIPTDQVTTFARACSKASRLKLRFVIIPEWPSSADEIILGSDCSYRTEEVKVIRAPENSAYRGFTPQNHAKLIRQLRGMESFSYQYDLSASCSPRQVTRTGAGAGTRTGVTNFIDILTYSSWHLNRLSSLDLRLTQMKDDVLAGILGKMSQLKSLNASGTPFGPLSLQALFTSNDQSSMDLDYYNGRSPEGLYKSIEILDISRCDNVNGQMIQKIFESCPQLKQFYGGMVEMESIVGGKDWVCHELTVLRFNLEMENRDGNVGRRIRDGNVGRKIRDDSTTKLYESIFYRLGKLTKLNTLSLAEYEMKKIKALDVSLRSGLSQLAGLKDMKELKFELGNNQRLAVDDAKWMLMSWPSLKCLFGPVSQKAKKLLEARDINVNGNKFNSLLVSKAFYSEGIPILWAKLYIYSQKLYPTGSALERHKHHIQELHFSNVFPEEYFLSLRGFPRLRILSSNGIISTLGYDYEESLVELILNQHSAFISAHSSTLERIEISATSTFCYTPNSILWNALAGCTSLKLLRLSEMNVLDHFKEFFAIWNVAETIELIEVTLPEWESVMTTLYPDEYDPENPWQSGNSFVLPGVRNLNMHYCPVHLSQAMFIRSCVNLESLVLGHTSDEYDSDTEQEDGTSSFAQTLIMDPWPLTQLTCLDISSTNFDDNQIANILSRICCLKELRVIGTLFGPASMNALFELRNMNIGEKFNGGDQAVKQPWRHSDSIETLVITGCVNVTSMMIQTILSGCKNLRVFVAHTIYASDIANGEEWICKDIENLHIFISVSKDEDEFALPSPIDLQRAVYSQLSKLIHLKILCITNVDRILPGLRTLQIKLGAGLELTKDLKSLRNFWFPKDNTQEMMQEDVQWIIDNWTMLKIFYGQMNQDLDIHDKLRVQLKAKCIINAHLIYG
ncbi:hypothetical protein BGZ76_009977 [Entomortierella beljakovae]|nr:hypothetical protein BGZ76_009977 [Entomortierella beljakovae]